MSVLEMDFDDMVVSVQGENGQTATIFMDADAAKELADWFTEVHTEIVKGEQDAGTWDRPRNDGAGCKEGSYNGDRCSLMGSGGEEAPADDKQLDLFPKPPRS